MDGGKTFGGEIADFAALLLQQRALDGREREGWSRDHHAAKMNDATEGAWIIDIQVVL